MTRLPNLILAGVGRAGTTSLFWHLSQHPDICASRVKEPRYFLPLSEHDAEADSALRPIEPYARLFDRCRSERFAMEATPHYFHGGRRLIDGLKRTLPDPRIVVTLRNPVARVWSVFTFAKGRMQLPAQMTFEEYLERCERLYRTNAPRPRKGERAYWSVRGGVYGDFLPVWLDSFSEDRLRVVFFERFAPDPVASMRELCAWLGIETSCIDSFDFSIENRSAGYRSRLLLRLALAANRESVLRNRRKLKAPLRRIYDAINRTTRRDRMPAAARVRLEELFAPSNAAVAARLAERGYADLPPWLRSVSPSATAAESP
jgi:Sulfotransferase family